MKPPTTNPGVPPEGLADIEARIQQLTQARAALERQRDSARAEELKVLADAYARKLNAAGFSIRDGMRALRPYATVRIQKPAEAPPVEHREPAADDLRAYALQVLGEDAAGWLRRPHPLLGGLPPSQVAATPTGQARVRALLVAYARGA